MADNTTQNGTDTIATDEVATLNGAASSGVKVPRTKVTFGDDGISRDVSTAFPLPVDEVHPARTLVTYYTEAYSVTAADALMTITGVNRGGTVTTTQLTVAAGKTLRVQAIHLTGVLLGSTVAATHVRLRANLAGAATVTSPIVLSARMGNPSVGTQAANYGLLPHNLTLPADGIEFPAGAGIQFSAISSTAAMHSVSASIIGYEY
jgi:hypothetical protein